MAKIFNRYISDAQSPRALNIKMDPNAVPTHELRDDGHVYNIKTGERLTGVQDSRGKKKRAVAKDRKAMIVRDSKNPKDDDNEATHEICEDGNLYDLKSGLVYLGAQDGYIERTTPEQREADEHIGLMGKKNVSPLILKKGSGEMDKKAAKETLTAVRDQLKRLIPTVKRKAGIKGPSERATDAATRNFHRWEGFNAAIIANQPNQSRDPGMAAYLKGSA